MLEYLLFSVVIIAILFYRYVSDLYVFQILLLVILVFFSGFRFEVGTDYPAYVRYFEAIDVGLVYFQGKEIGFTILNYINKFYLSLGYQSVFFICAFFTITIISLSLSRFNSRYIYVFGMFIFVFSGFYTQSFNIIRQSLSMAICLYSLNYINERKPFVYFFIIIIALLFHSTAVIFLPLYFIFKVDFERKLLFVALVFAFIFGDFSFKILSLLFEYFDIRYLHFLNEGEDDVTSGSGLMQYVTLVICLFSIYHKEKIDSKYFIYFKVFYLYCFFNLIFFEFMLGIRAIQGLKLSMLVFVPYLFSLFQGRYKYLIILLCFIYYVGFVKYLDNSTNIIPYNLNLSF